MKDRSVRHACAAAVVALLAAAGCDRRSPGTPTRTGVKGRAMAAPGAAARSRVDPSLPPLRVALIPIENPEKLVDDVKPAFRFLEEKLGRRIVYHVTLDYSAAVVALRGGTADVSFMPPLPYVLAHAQTGAEAVLGEVYTGRSYYHARIFVRVDRGIDKLEDLRGKTIAYVDPISSSGYMYPHDIFVRAGLARPSGGFFRRVYFAGGDQQAIQSVVNKTVDAAGVGEFAVNLLRLEERGAVKSIAVSQKIPSHCVVVRKGLAPALRQRFVAAMLSLNDKENRDLAQKLYGTEAYVKVTHADFADVEKMARRYGLLKN